MRTAALSTLALALTFASGCSSECDIHEATGSLKQFSGSCLSSGRNAEGSVIFTIDALDTPDEYDGLADSVEFTINPPLFKGKRGTAFMGLGSVPVYDVPGWADYVINDYTETDNKDGILEVEIVEAQTYVEQFGGQGRLRAVARVSYITFSSDE